MTEDYEERKLRAGRLSFYERLVILERLGEIAKERYSDNVVFNSQGYNLSLIKNGLQVESDPFTFTNKYYVDTGNIELNLISRFFEYGTGIHNTEYRNSDFIRPTNYKYMKFVGTRKYAGVIIFSKKVKGVRPIMMYQRTIKSMEQDREFLQRKIRMEIGI